MTFEPTETEINAQDDIDEPYVEPHEALRYLWEWIGLPLICFHGACRRSRLCTQEHSHRLFGSPCHAHHREEVRFILRGPDGLLTSSTRA